MNNTTLLVGILHDECYLDDIVRFLFSENMKQKRVMVELTKSPVSSKLRGTFFKKIANHIVANGGILIYGDDEKILERTYAKYAELWQKATVPGISFMEYERLRSEMDHVIPLIERDPHFLKVATEQNPDIIILGREHIPFLIEKRYSNLPHREVYIPVEK
jgi:hypothetical protein